MKRLRLLPLVFVAAPLMEACPPAAPLCGEPGVDACRPDGGPYCPEDCGALKKNDGGIALDDAGEPTCFC